MSVKTNTHIPSVNRIIIGDVGSGKTIVAFLLIIGYLKGIKKAQTALLAPTEVLAFQHYQKLIELKTKNLKLLDWLDIIFLSGKNLYFNQTKLTRKKLEKLLTSLNPLKICWVGTHALLHSDLIKPNLVLVDEQHRFGVKQRQILSQQELAHFISLTATPIPRTLALTIFGNLKPHFLQTLKSRNPIKTQKISLEKLDTDLIEAIKRHLNLDRKVYIICPRIEDKDEPGQEKLWSVQKTLELMERFFPKQILSVHGKSVDKSDILEEFKKSKDKNILISTTVVEVGVDVGQASLMIILNAERFGLSALHQIRGRIGRNNFTDNECLLLTSPEFLRSKRLYYLEKYQDGFKIAEKDLQIRGSGDMLGQLQSGFGDEIDSLLGLDPELYYKLNTLVANTDLNQLESLPRLKSYLDKESQKIWQE